MDAVERELLNLARYRPFSSIGWSAVHLYLIGRGAVFLHPIGRGVARYHQIVQDIFRFQLIGRCRALVALAEQSGKFFFFSTANSVSLKKTSVARLLLIHGNVHTRLTDSREN